MTVQAMLDIAGRYWTAMADAMIAACVNWAVENNVSLRIPRRGHAGGYAGGCVQGYPSDDLDQEGWRRMVEGNSDTKYCHV